MSIEPALDPEQYDSWVVLVIIIDQTNWLEVLQDFYNSIEDNRIPHFRFAVHNGMYGFSLRLLATPDSDIVKGLEKITNDRGLRYSINPKQKNHGPFCHLSGWFDGQEEFNWDMTWVMMLFNLSRMAAHMLSLGARSSKIRIQIVHQFCNMMAITDTQYVSLFKLR